MRSGILLLGVTPLAIGLIISELNSQETPQAPQIQTEDKTNRTLEGEQKPNAEIPSTPPASADAPRIIPPSTSHESQRNSDKSEEEGTEFWSPLFGYRVKITDSLLVIFTFLLFVATVLLWLATRNLVR